MKRLLTLTILIFIFNSSNAQLVYFNMGYSGNSTSLSGLNQVIDRYNSSRTWLDKEMGHFGYLDGYMLGWGMEIANAWFEMEMSFRGQKRKASGIDLTGQDGQRQLRYRNNTFALSIGGMGGESGFHVGGGLRTDFGGAKLKTKINRSSENGDWEQVGDNFLSLRSGPALKMIFGDEGPCFSISAYYCWSFFKDNYAKQDEILNNTNHGFDEPEIFDNRPNVFGFTIGFGASGT